MPITPSAGFLKLLLLIPAMAYIGLMLFAGLFGNRLTFPAPPPGYSDSEDILKFQLNGSEETISMIYLESPGSPFLIYYHHGNGEDLQSILPRLGGLRDQGYSVLAWDYPGYGTSTGSPSEKSVLKFAEGIWMEIPERFGFDHEQVILYGRSVGGGPAMWLASEFEAAGLILEGTFTSIFRVGLGIKLLPWDIFDNLRMADSLRCPSLFIHGTDDRTVPFSHAVKLHQRAASPKFFTWINNGQHNDVVDAYPDIYYSSLQRFREFISRS